MNKKRIAAGFVVFVLGIAILVGVMQPEPEQLTMVVIPSEEPVLAREEWAPFIDYMSEQLGAPLRLLLVSDYTAAVEALKYGHADVARLTAFGYILAAKEFEVEPIAVANRLASGEPSYKAMIVALSPTSLDGLDFAFVDVGSTSGYLAPMTYILQEGTELGRIYFAGTHSAVIEAVKNGSVGAGATADSRYLQALSAGVIEEGEFTILWESGPIMNAPIVVRGNMDDDLKEKFQEALFSMPREIVMALGTKETGYVRAQDSDYDFVRQMQHALEELE